MKRLYPLFLITSLSLASAIAQDRGTGIIGNYYYRVRNAGQDRYVYVRDNYDESDIARQQPDFGQNSMSTSENRMGQVKKGFMKSM